MLKSIFQNVVLQFEEHKHTEIKMKNYEKIMYSEENTYSIHPLEKNIQKNKQFNRKKKYHWRTPCTSYEKFIKHLPTHFDESVRAWGFLRKNDEQKMTPLRVELMTEAQ